jgi:hypothetical protein
LTRPRRWRPLLLAAGQFRGQVPQPVAEPDVGQGLRGSRRLPLGRSYPERDEGRLYVLLADRVRIRLKAWKMKPIEAARTW